MKTIGTYYYLENKIIINGHEHVSAPAKIILCLVLDDYIILLLDAVKLKTGNNIYCYDITGQLRWVISDLDADHQNNQYTSIYVLEDLNLYAYNIIGIEVKINYLNGKILKTELIK